MKTLLTLVMASLFAMPLNAETPGEPVEDGLFFSVDEVDLSQFKWKNRPVVVFADSELDPAFVEQMRLLRARTDQLIARDVVVITDTNPAVLSDLRRQLRPRDFGLVIMSKEGVVNVRKPFPWDVREISRSIDKMPIRKREIREQRTPATGG